MPGAKGASSLVVVLTLLLGDVRLCLIDSPIMPGDGGASSSVSSVLAGVDSSFVSSPPRNSLRPALDGVLVVAKALFSRSFSDPFFTGGFLPFFLLLVSGGPILYS